MLLKVFLLFQEGPSTPKKRRFMEPRYINEISPSHVRTPRRAKRVLEFVKRSYKNQTVKVKKLQDANRALNKRIRTLEDMVTHLKQKNLLSEQAGDQMLVSNITYYFVIFTFVKKYLIFRKCEVYLIIKLLLKVG